MAWAWLTIPYTFVIILFIFGINLTMIIKDVSSLESGYSLTTTHESIANLIKKSTLISAHCSQSKKHQCLHVYDYSMVKTYLPIKFEVCNTSEEKLSCDDLNIKLHFTSKDIFMIGLRK